MGNVHTGSPSAIHFTLANVPAESAGAAPSTAPSKVEIISTATSNATQQKQAKLAADTVLSKREVAVEKIVISREGMTSILGKASRYASFKDGMMRFFYKVGNRLKPDVEFGSNHKAVNRLADEYQALKKATYPDEKAQLKVLAQLQEKLENMRARQMTDGVLLGHEITKANATPAHAALALVKQEIDALPSNRYAKALTSWSEGYGQLKDAGASIPEKLALLREIQGHLDAADPDEVLPDVNEKRVLVQQEIADLEAHQPLKDELAAFVQNKGGKLKQVETRVADPLNGIRHEAYMKQVTSDPERELDHLMVGLQITGFNPGSLKHVETQERTGLQQAQADYFDRSLDDLITSTFGESHVQAQPSLVKDPDLDHLSANFRFLHDAHFLLTGPAFKMALEKADTKWAAGLAKDLGGLMAADIAKLAPDIQLGFITSRGEAFKDRLLQALNTQLRGNDSPLGSSYATASKEVKSFLDQAYNHAMSSLPDRQVDADHCVFGGHTYTKVGHLGEGGFGTVDLYERRWQENGQDKVDRIAVKAPRPDDSSGRAAQFAASSVEVRGHRSADAGGHVNVIGFKGAARTADGRILIASEYASRGDVHHFIEKLADAEKQGTVSSRAATLVRMTLLQDMMLGMQHVQEQRGMTHLDVKPVNYFIGEDGSAKLGDFGTAAAELERKFTQMPVDSLAYTAPEMLHDREARIQARGAELARIQNKEAPALKSQDELSDRISSTVITATDKVDIWALGVSAFQLFFNRVPFDAAFGSDQEKMIRDFDGDVSRHIESLYRSVRQGSQEGGVSGHSSLVRLLNQMLNPDPQRRPSLTDILNNSLFQEGGVGSHEVRDLIQKLTDPVPDLDDIRKASAALGV